MFCWAGATVVVVAAAGGPVVEGVVVKATVVIVGAMVVVVVAGTAVVVVAGTVLVVLVVVGATVVVVVVAGTVVSGAGSAAVSGTVSAGSCSTPANVVAKADRPSSAVAATKPTRAIRECQRMEERELGVMAKRGQVGNPAKSSQGYRRVECRSGVRNSSRLFPDRSLPSRSPPWPATVEDA